MLFDTLQSENDFKKSENKLYGGLRQGFCCSQP